MSELSVMSHQKQDHTKTGPLFKVSSKRLEKKGVDLAIPEFVVSLVIDYTTAAPLQYGVILHQEGT